MPSTMLLLSCASWRQGEAEAAREADALRRLAALRVTSGPPRVEKKSTFQVRAAR